MNSTYAKSSLLAAAALLALSLPLTAFAQMHEMPMNDHKGCQEHVMDKGHMDKMGDMMGMCMAHADKMGLTDDQMAKMKPVHSDMQKKQARYKADLKIAEIELQEVMEVKNFDLEKAGFAVKKIAEIKTAHHLEMLKAMKEMRTVLTDEQFNKMNRIMPMEMGARKHAKKQMKK